MRSLRFANKAAASLRSPAPSAGTAAPLAARCAVTSRRTEPIVPSSPMTSRVGGDPGLDGTNDSLRPIGISSRPGCARTSVLNKSRGGSAGSGSYGSLTRPSTAISGTTNNETAPSIGISAVPRRSAENDTAATTLVAA